MLGLILSKIMGVRPDGLEEARQRLRDQSRKIAELHLRNANAKAASRLEQLNAAGVPFYQPPQAEPAPRPATYHPLHVYETDEATGYPYKPTIHFEQDPIFGWDLNGFGGFDTSFDIPLSAFPREMFPERPTTLRTQIAQDAVRFQSRVWFETIPQYSGPIGHLVNYVVGDGMEIDVVEREKDEDAEEAVGYEQDDPTPKAAAAEVATEAGEPEEASPDQKLAAAVQTWLDGFATFKHNRLCDRVAESVINLLRDGEDALRVIPGPEFPTVRSVDTSTIRGPHNEITGPWAYGILTSWPKDFEDIKAFHLWYPDNTHEDVLPEVMSLCKLETTGSNVKRGVPMAYAARKQLPQMAKLLDCLAVGEAARQAIPYIRQFNAADRAAVRAATPSSLDTWAVAEQEYNAAIGYGGYARHEDLIQPGEVPLINRGQEFIDTPQGRAESGALAYRTLCEALATCWQVPIWFITGSADSENYASSLVSESPVVKKVVRIQAKISGHYEAICKAALKFAINAGEFPADTLERVEVHCELSTPVARDPDKAIDSDLKLLDKKLLSPQHLCTRNGLDFEEETDLIAQAEQNGWQAQTAMELAQADQLAKQGGDGQPQPPRAEQWFEQWDESKHPRDDEGQWSESVGQVFKSTHYDHPTIKEGFYSGLEHGLAKLTRSAATAAGFHVSDVSASTGTAYIVLRNRKNVTPEKGITGKSFKIRIATHDVPGAEHYGLGAVPKAKDADINAKKLGSEGTAKAILQALNEAEKTLAEA